MYLLIILIGTYIASKDQTVECNMVEIFQRSQSTNNVNGWNKKGCAGLIEIIFY